jgi:RimJ/RimL family protein N-acetyltransferase
MKLITLHDKRYIEDILRKNVALHLYEIGDLDDFCWPYTTWYATQDTPPQIALLYTGGPTPVLLALSDQPETQATFLQALRPLLPRTFDLHLTSNAITILEEDYHITSYGPHYKMALHDRERLANIDTTHVVQLNIDDLDSIEQIYHESYPTNWFERRMLETQHYFGLYMDRMLVSVAGVHVYSPRFKVATLGNVTTHPAYRGRGFGTAVCARLCQVLLRTVEHIGLNVKVHNSAALACYERLGFANIATYNEYHCSIKQ